MTDPNSDDGILDFAPDTSPASPQTKLKPPQVPLPGAPVVLAYHSANTCKPKSFDADAIKNFYLPIGLLGGGVLIDILSAIIWRHDLTETFAALTVDLTVGTAIMLGAMLIAARLRGIDLGKLGVAAYKLAAISIAPAALMEFVTPIARFVPLGGILCWVAEFFLFFALLGALFDLDESDTWYCVFIMFLTRLAIYFIMLGFIR